MTRPAFRPPPFPDTRDGAPRKVGVELEFAGIDPADAAGAVADALGAEARETGPEFWELDGPGGAWELYRDTALRKSESGRRVAELAAPVIPVECVAPPLPLAELGAVEAAAAALARAGASGSENGVLLGLGMHLNVETRSVEARDLVPVVRAFAMIEDSLRAADPIDLSRRALPFVDPFPSAFVSAAAAGADWDFDALLEAVLTHTPTRNRALDVLPVLKFVDEARVTAALGEGVKIGARPAWHYRLPDCRIDAPDWSIAREWDRWLLVEEVAARPDLLDALAEARADFDARLIALPGAWRKRADAVLEAAGLSPAARMEADERRGTEGAA